jgi:hypothetical protein
MLLLAKFKSIKEQKLIYDINVQYIYITDIHFSYLSSIFSVRNIIRKYIIHVISLAQLVATVHGTG